MEVSDKVDLISRKVMYYVLERGVYKNWLIFMNIGGFTACFLIFVSLVIAVFCDKKEQ